MSERLEQHTKAYKKHVESKFKEAYFEAMMSFQSIESLLKDCIQKTYEILNINAHPSVKFEPTKRDIKNLERKGLGGLVSDFKKVSTHQELCESIEKLTKRRNKLAHVTAGEFIMNELIQKPLTEIDKDAGGLDDLAKEASDLFLALSNVYEALLKKQQT